MRIRITFSKTEAMRYTSHLDLQRTWERTLRRARLPLAYTQGFNPHPRLNLGAALPLGFTSQGEILEVWLEGEIPLGDIESALNPVLPPGIEISLIEETELWSPKVQNLIQTISYQISCPSPPSDIGKQIESILAKSELIRERKGKEYDLRPLIHTLQLDEQSRITMRLSALPGATGRPDEVLLALGIDPHEAHIHRTEIALNSD